MNTRIQDLVYRATEYYSNGESRWFDKEKFAELIIADVGQIVSGLIVPETWEQDPGPYEHWNRALGTVALEIEQHFYGDAHEV